MPEITLFLLQNKQVVCIKKRMINHGRGVCVCFIKLFKKSMEKKEDTIKREKKKS